jgi:hypothetical protein
MSTVGAHADIEPMRCDATTRMRSADSARLPMAARRHGSASRLVACELAAGHDGSHMTFLGTSDGYDRWWWLQWGPHAREVLTVDPCAARGSSGEYQDECLLPDRHLGSHSFNTRPSELRRIQAPGAAFG